MNYLLFSTANGPQLVNMDLVTRITENNITGGATLLLPGAEIAVGHTLKDIQEMMKKA
ncbi:hypothetical protein [Chitinophaga sp. YIM B06452]|uniref:hypothetical protein n=1 Tax=Chitinophaga sp. YIM B06452 TaxID=3082158 RepID=UPI0031FF3196